MTHSIQRVEGHTNTAIRQMTHNNTRFRIDILCWNLKERGPQWLRVWVTARVSGCSVAQRCKRTRNQEHNYKVRHPFIVVDNAVLCNSTSLNWNERKTRMYPFYDTFTNTSLVNGKGNRHCHDWICELSYANKVRSQLHNTACIISKYIVSWKMNYDSLSMGN